LEYIATKELGEGKVQTDVEIPDGENEYTYLWREKPEAFLEYNYRDVEAVTEIDEEVGVTELFSNLRQLVGCQFESCDPNVTLLDVMFLREADTQDIVLPTATAPETGDFFGAYVFPPEDGLHEHTIYPDLACFTDDHTILTPNGEVNITELSVGDEIYTLDQDTHEMVVDTVAETHEYEYCGEMYELSNKTLDMKITPNHNIYHTSSNTGRRETHTPDDYSLSEIQDIPEKTYQYLPTHDPIQNSGCEFIDISESVSDVYATLHVSDGRRARHKLPDCAEWQETSLHIGSLYQLPIEQYRDYKDVCDDVADEVAFRDTKHSHEKPTTFDADAFGEFIGWFVSEGSVSGSQIKIEQHGEHNERIENTITEMGHECTDNGQRVRFSNSVLARWLDEHCGENSFEKKIPDLLYELGDAAEQRCFEALILGDGHGEFDGNSMRYYTSSSELVDDVKHLAIRRGYKPNVSSRNRTGNTEYTINIVKNTGSIEKNKHADIVDFNGNVYCVTGEKNHVVLATRGDTYEWIGQSLYPHLILQCNISPETIIGTEDDLQDSAYTKDDCVYSYIDTQTAPSQKSESDPVYEKCYFVDHETESGFVSDVVEEILALNEIYAGTDLYGASKQIRNSVWGYLGDSDSFGKGTRLFDWRMGEAITLGNTPQRSLLSISIRLPSQTHQKRRMSLQGIRILS